MTRKKSSQFNTESIDAVFARMEKNKDKLALIWQGEEYSYADFLVLIKDWEMRLEKDGVRQGTICAFIGDYSPHICAFIFALMRIKAILVPLTKEVATDLEKFMNITGVQVLYRFDKNDSWQMEETHNPQIAPLILSFLQRQHPGLVVFTSGSAGTPKGILHDCELVMEKFVEERTGWRTVLFLLMDHFGGFNTLLSSFAYSGVGICLNKRTPEEVMKAIQTTSATLLPTTPTFLNLLIAGRFYENFDLSSIELITYGTELMTETTLKKVAEIFPNAKLKQTYGLSEQGVLRSKSLSNDSVWVKIGGPGFEIKVIDNILWIRSRANMVGYLNAPNPFDDENWMCTGDEVEVKGEYIRFLGRKSEIINVGGKKVYPIEVENVLLQAENIKSATVFAKSHPIMGKVVHANVSVLKPEDKLMLSERLRTHCNKYLAKYKVPLRFNLDEDVQHNVRFKKIRRPSTK